MPVRKEHIAAGLFVVAGYLGLAGLDNTSFWDDEAHVGVIARNFLSTGRLTGWDGRNLLAYRDGALLDDDLDTINPPLEYLLAAASFKTFGVTTWAGRFPFVIAGLAALALYCLILRRDFGGDSWHWVYSLAILGLSVVFLLSIRQCRYYAIGMLLSLLSYYLYRRCLASRERRYYVMFAGASLLLFYANYLLWAAFMGALVLAFGVFHRRRIASSWRELALAVGIIAAGSLPWAIVHRVWCRPDMRTAQAWYVRKAVLIWWNLRELNTIGCMPWIAAAALLLFLLWARRAGKNVTVIIEWAVVAVAYTVFLGLLSPQPLGSKVADVRYAIPAVPFLAGLVGAVAWFIHRRSRAGAIALCVVVLTTNLLSVGPPGWRFRWLLPAYVRQVHNDYPTAHRQIAAYLNEHAEQDDLVFAYDTYANTPIMFYLGHKVRICCELTGDSHLPAETIRGLDAPLLMNENFPDWFVQLGTGGEEVYLRRFFSRPHERDGKVVASRYEVRAVLDVYHKDTSRPELHLHRFSPPRDFDRKSEAVYVFRRVGSQ